MMNSEKSVLAALRAAELLRTIALALAVAASGVVASFVAPAILGAQQLVVQHNANLRRDPSTLHPAIRVLIAGDTIQLLTAHTTNDFLRVRAGSDTGWVFSALVEILALANPPTPVPGPAVVTTAP